MAASKISINSVGKSYYNEKEKTSLKVIDNISLDVADKEFVVLLGSSGCGKSTLLKVMGGILPATEGSISFDGRDYGDELPPELAKRIGFVFQNDNLLQWRTVYGNLKFMLDIMHLKGQEWEDRILEMLTIVGLQDYMKVYPHELSGGMKQRVGIARALVHDPELLILDQPLGALDAITRKILVYEILNIWRKSQKTIVMSTNDVDEALILANRIVILSPLPAHIMHEVIVDIPVEERDLDIENKPRFIELRRQINDVIRLTGGEKNG